MTRAMTTPNALEKAIRSIIIKWERRREQLNCSPSIYDLFVAQSGNELAAALRSPVPSEAAAKADAREAGLRANLDVIAGHASAIMKAVDRGAIPPSSPPSPATDPGQAGDADGIVGRLLRIDVADDAPDTAEADIGEAAAEIERLQAEVARLKDRLEISHVYDANGNPVPMSKEDEVYDGIFCRDETIRLLEGQIEKWRAEVARRDATARREAFEKAAVVS